MGSLQFWHRFAMIDTGGDIGGPPSLASNEGDESAESGKHEPQHLRVVLNVD